MLDTRMRAALGPALEAAGRRLAAGGVSPAALTAAGWAAGAGACAATALRAWPVALGLWLANRLLDGLDGAVARAGAATDAGGVLGLRPDLRGPAGRIPRPPTARPRAPPARAGLAPGHALPRPPALG